MTQTAIHYAKALHELSISKESMEETEAIIREVPKVLEILESPVVSKEEKHGLIDKLFPGETRAFLKLLCDYGRADQFYHICEAYREEYKKRHHILEAEVFSVKPLTEEEKQNLECFLHEKYPGMQYEITFDLDEKLIGGQLIRIGNVEYDSSYRKCLYQLEQKLTGR